MGHYFYVSYWRRDRHLTWSSESREGLAICRAKAVPSFLSYFKTLNIVPTPGIKPATSSSAVKRSTYWANRQYAVAQLHLTEDFRLLLHNVFECIRFSSSISSIKSPVNCTTLKIEKMCGGYLVTFVNNNSRPVSTFFSTASRPGNLSMHIAKTVPPL